jgi:hypothetical protein
VSLVAHRAADLEAEVFPRGLIVPEVVLPELLIRLDEAVKVLSRLRDGFGLDITMDEALVGGAAIDATGEPLPVLCRITRVKDAGEYQEIRAESTIFGLRWIFFAPDSVAATYAGASDADRVYFYFADDAGLMSDGSDGYRFI